MSAGISKRLDFRGRQSQMIINAVSGSNYPATPADGYALTQANFPGLREAFFSDGISGNNLVGEFGTVTITSSTGWTIPAAGQFRRVTAGTVTTSGAWTAIGTRHAVLIAIGSMNISVSNLLRLGAASGTGSQLTVNTSPTGNICGPSAGNSMAFPGSGLSSAVLGMAMKLDQRTANGHGYQYFYDGTNSEGPIVETVLIGDVSTSWSAFNLGAGCASFATNASSYYTGIFFLALDHPIDDSLIIGALPWMVAHPQQLYSGFYKRS